MAAATRSASQRALSLTPPSKSGPAVPRYPGSPTLSSFALDGASATSAEASPSASPGHALGARALPAWLSPTARRVLVGSGSSSVTAAQLCRTAHTPLAAVRGELGEGQGHGGTLMLSPHQQLDTALAPVRSAAAQYGTDAHAAAGESVVACSMGDAALSAASAGGLGADGCEEGPAVHEAVSVAGAAEATGPVAAPGSAAAQPRAAAERAAAAAADSSRMAVEPMLTQHVEGGWEHLTDASLGAGPPSEDGRPAHTDVPEAASCMRGGACAPAGAAARGGALRALRSLVHLRQLQALSASLPRARWLPVQLSRPASHSRANPITGLSSDWLCGRMLVRLIDHI